MFTQAITRTPGKDFARGLTTADLGRPDIATMRRQHRAYVETLEGLGLAVETLPPLEGYPDAYFVEDAAIMTPEVAIVTRPGAMARRGEERAIEASVTRHRRVAHIEPPGTIEGGDVLFVGKRVYVGLSARTNRAGIEQLRAILAPHGYSVQGVPVKAGLHLKSSVSQVGPDTLLLGPPLAACDAWDGLRRLRVPLEEAYAANALLINDHLLLPSGYPATRELLESLGMPIIELDSSEARKMDGGLSCMSLRF